MLDRNKLWPEGTITHQRVAMTGPRGSFYRPEKACPRPERVHSSPDIRNIVQDLNGFILGLREPIITACITNDVAQRTITIIQVFAHSCCVYAGA